MKAILEFNLPEDKEEFDAASKGMDWAIIAWDMDQLLRNKLKYGTPAVALKIGDSSTHHVHLLEELREALNEMLLERGLQYPQ